jgi:hypothetical protein
MSSTFGTLNWLEIGKGFLMAFIGSILGAILSSLSGNTIAWTWVYFQPIVYSSLAAGISYLIKTVFQNSEGVPLALEPKK